MRPIPNLGSVPPRGSGSHPFLHSGECPALGHTTCGVHLNDRAYGRNVPAAVWDYKLGGYQALKKWLSYRERAILGRPLTPDEIHHFTTTARRIAAILLLAAATSRWNTSAS